MKRIDLILVGLTVLTYPLYAIDKGDYTTAQSALTIKGPAIVSSSSNSSMLDTVRTGDLNGDGIKDMVLASDTYSAAPTGVHNGIIAILYGKASYPTNIDLSTTNPDFVIYGPGTALNDTHTGKNIAVGDLDGDGIDDLVVAHWNHSWTPHRVVIFWGGATLTSHANPWYMDYSVGANTPNVVIEFPSLSVQSNHSLAIADLNGDGRNDLVIGQPSVLRAEDSSTSRTGVTQVILGVPRATWGTYVDLKTFATMNPTLTHWTILGANEYAIPFTLNTDERELFGYDVAVGNVNGDINAMNGKPINDIIIGAPGGDGPLDTAARADSGKAVVVLGGFPNTAGFTATATGATLTTLTVAGATWTNDQFKWCQLKITGGLGAANTTRYVTANNGTTITVNTAFTVMPGAGTTFQVRVIDTRRGYQDLTIYGKEGFGTHSTPPLAGNDLRSDRLGAGVACADMNHDGKDDIIVTTRGDSTAGANPSKIFVFYGRTYLGQKYDDASFFSATTIGKSGNTWAVNRFTNCFVKIVTGTGAGQVRKIASNTNTLLTIDTAWPAPNFSPAPDATSDFVIMTYDMLYGDAGIPVVGDQPDMVIKGNTSGNLYTLGERNLTAADVNADGYKDLLFGNSATDANMASYAVYSDIRSSPKTYDMTVADTGTDTDGVADDGYDVKIAGVGGMVPSADYPDMEQLVYTIAGGDLNGDGVGNEILACNPLALSLRGACYLFMANRLPMAEMSSSVRGKKFTNYYRINPNNTMGEVMRSKISSD